MGRSDASSGMTLSKGVASLTEDDSELRRRPKRRFAVLSKTMWRSFISLDEMLIGNSENSREMK